MEREVFLTSYTRVDAIILQERVVISQITAPNMCM